MITLSYARRDKALAEKIEKILQDSSLAYQIEKRSDRKEISLKDGNLNIKGENEILEHLDELRAELHQWYYCAC